MIAPIEPSSPTGHTGRRVRNAAIRGVLVASLVIAVILALRGQGDASLLAAVVLALAASAILETSLGQRRQDHQAMQARSSHHFGVADTLLSQIPDPVILVDGRAIVVEANAAARTLFPGLKVAQPLSFALRDPGVLGAIEAVLGMKEPSRVEYSERIPTERTFEVHLNPLKSGAQHADLRSGVVLFFRDLTSARRLEDMRVDFVANASHELRTPLASLLGFIETLQGPAREDAKARERFLEVMRGQAQRMTRLIDDLLSLSRIEMRVHLPPNTVVDLAAIVAQMVDTLSPLAKERGVRIQPDIAAAPLPVLGDRDELLRVVENLIENAVKYGESGGRVDVGLQRVEGPGAPAGLAVLSVRDYGPGIAPEHLPRLTERFYRADTAQSREKGGTGLGLAIVKHIVNRHRGQLAIESEVGQGACFQVTLPGAAAAT